MSAIVAEPFGDWSKVLDQRVRQRLLPVNATTPGFATIGIKLVGQVFGYEKPVSRKRKISFLGVKANG